MEGCGKSDGGDLYVRSGPGTMRMGGEDAERYVTTRFGTK